MAGMSLWAALCVCLCAECAKAETFDLSGYRPQSGLEAAVDGDSLVVHWDGEADQELRARFALVRGIPSVRELAARNRDGEWTILGRDLVPEFGVTTGVRRTGHGLD